MRKHAWVLALGALTATNTVLALLLQRLRRWWEPDWSLGVFAIANTIIILFARLVRHLRRNDPDGEDGLIDIATYAAGALPLAIWFYWRRLRDWETAWTQAIAVSKEGVHGANTTEGLAAGSRETSAGNR